MVWPCTFGTTNADNSHAKNDGKEVFLKLCYFQIITIELYRDINLGTEHRSAWLIRDAPPHNSQGYVVWLIIIALAIAYCHTYMYNIMGTI